MQRVGDVMCAERGSYLYVRRPYVSSCNRHWMEWSETPQFLILQFRSDRQTDRHGQANMRIFCNFCSRFRQTKRPSSRVELQISSGFPYVRHVSFERSRFVVYARVTVNRSAGYRHAIALVAVNCLYTCVWCLRGLKCTCVAWVPCLWTERVLLAH
jgi:hypothetical protein